MNIFEHFGESFDAIFNNKLRSVLSTLGVVIGISSVVVMLGIGEGVRESIIKNLTTTNDVVVISPSYGGYSREKRGGDESGGELRKPAKNVITYDNINILKEKVPNIRTVIPIARVDANMTYKGKHTRADIKGVDNEFLSAKQVNLDYGYGILPRHLKNNEKVAVIGYKKVADIFKGENPIGEQLVIGGQLFNVIGVLDKKDNRQIDNSVLIPITTAQKRLNSNKLEKIEAYVKDIFYIDQTKRNIQYLLFKLSGVDSPSSVKFRIETNADALKQADKIVGGMQLFLGGIASISLLVGGIGVMNIMLVSVTERTREIGIRKSIGARKKDILLQFLIESIVISIIGGIIAVGLSYGIAEIINNMGMDEFKTVITTRVIILACSVSMGMGVLFGIMPAWKAAKLKPIDALRFE
ncbi:MAG: ABC transporter permease [Candidatus Gracilibacteria bacterium]|nr:ABC transporter permease [Candidatus Gracilibacteria bacterium]